MWLVFDINPVAKPRMTRSDQWKKRPATTKYWEFKDEICIQAKELGYELEDEVEVIFNIEMPASWSKKKKEKMNGWPHHSTPDIDNLVKSLFDSLLGQDKSIWRVVAEKRWSHEGSIHIKAYKD